MFHEKKATNFARYISNGDFSPALSYLVIKFPGKNFSFPLGPNVFYNMKSAMQCHNFCMFKTRGQNNQLPTLQSRLSHFHNRKSFAAERYRVDNALAKPQN